MEQPQLAPLEGGDEIEVVTIGHEKDAEYTPKQKRSSHQAVAEIKRVVSHFQNKTNLLLGAIYSNLPLPDVITGRFGDV